MATKVHDFKVHMTCEACSGAVQRVLNKHRGAGVEDVVVSLPDQRVSVTSSLAPDELLEIIKKTGNSVEFIGTSK